MDLFLVISVNELLTEDRHRITIMLVPPILS